MTQTDPFGNEPQGAPTAPAVQFDVDTIKQASLGVKVALGGAAVTFIAAFMTWGSINLPSELEGFGVATSASGMDGGDGKLTVLMAIAVGALCVVQLIKGWNKGMAIGAISCASISTLVGVMNYFDIKDVSGDMPAGFDVSVSVGFGLYLTILAGIAMIVGSVLHFKGNTTTESAPAAI